MISFESDPAEFHIIEFAVEKYGISGSLFSRHFIQTRYIFKDNMQ